MLLQYCYKSIVVKAGSRNNGDPMTLEKFDDSARAFIRGAWPLCLIAMPNMLILAAFHDPDIFFGSCLAERFFSEHFENEFVNVLVSVVKTKLAFFQMKVKSVFCQAPKAHKSRFCKCPEAFNTINV